MLSKITHIDFYDSDRSIRIKSPDTVENLFFRQNDPFILQEINKQLKFFPLDLK